MPENNYAADVKFLKKHTPIVELKGYGEARVAVAPAYQGRVMTSSLAGSKGASFGWINQKLIEAEKDDVRFNNYGGEDRFWMGPEAGQFGLWFAKGEPFDVDHWKTPAGFNTGAFDITSQGGKSVAMAANFSVANASGASFQCAVKRTIDLLDEDRAACLLGSSVPPGVGMVGFASTNTLANVGPSAWARNSGLLSIWILGQFKPLLAGKVIVPFIPGQGEGLSDKKVTVDYFGPLGEDRGAVRNDVLLFGCDGLYRSKIGVSPSRARNVLGSYDANQNILTVVQFNLPAGAAKLPYVNSLWEHQAKPFDGDVANSYNDGPETGLGGFYEIETSSPAAELAPGESIVHVHRTFHFSGPFEALNTLSLRVLGFDLASLPK